MAIIQDRSRQQEGGDRFLYKKSVTRKKCKLRVTRKYKKEVQRGKSVKLFLVSHPAGIFSFLMGCKFVRSCPVS